MSFIRLLAPFLRVVLFEQGHGNVRSIFRVQLIFYFSEPGNSFILFYYCFRQKKQFYSASHPPASGTPPPLPPRPSSPRSSSPCRPPSSSASAAASPRPPPSACPVRAGGPGDRRPCPRLWSGMGRKCINYTYPTHLANSRKPFRSIVIGPKRHKTRL